MKLIIDIPEEDYKFIKDLQNLIIGGRGNCKTIQHNVINAIKNGTPYFPLPEDVFYKITDAEWEHSDNFWVTTPSGKKIEFEKKRPQSEWIKINSLGNGNAQYMCSNCHHGDEQAESQEVPYCWHCGAKMMKGGKEE